MEALLRREALLTSEIRELRIEALYGSDDRAREIYRAIQRKTQYRSQRDNLAADLINRKEDGRWVLSWLGDRMCNLTSLARALDSQGISFDTPWSQGEDELEAIRPLNEPRTQTRTLMNLARDAGMNLTEIVWKGWEVPDNIGMAEWESIQWIYVDRGFSVIFSIGGHIMTLQGVEPDGLRVDDPFGKVSLKPSSAITKIEETQIGKKTVAVGKYTVENPEAYWEYTALTRNKRFGREAWRGNDHLIPWSEALTHRMYWVMLVGGTEISK